MNYSKQREMILEYLSSTKSHPTAEQIYSVVRKKDNKISLGTVYRNLDKLSKEGIIKRIKTTGTKDRFDFDTSAHMHGVCLKCGKVFDIYHNLENLNKVIEEEKKCKILSSDVIFNIICSDCTNEI